MKLRWKSVTDPFLLFLLAFAIGTFCLIHPVAGHVTIPVIQSPRLPPPAPPLVNSPLPKPPSARPPDIVKLRANLESAQAVVMAQLATLNASEAELQEAQRRVDALRAELEALEAKRASLRPVSVPSPTTAEADRLESSIDQQRQEVARLEATLAQERTRKPLLERAIVPVNKLPVLVELIDNRIAPVTKEYFHFPLLTLKPSFVVRRIRSGETIAQARRLDSDFASFLSTIQPRRSYLSCLLNSDSFDAFYAVRELAAKARVDIGWEPVDTRSGRITLVGVRLGSPFEKKSVPVPDIIK